MQCVNSLSRQSLLVSDFIFGFVSDIIWYYLSNLKKNINKEWDGNVPCSVWIHCTQCAFFNVPSIDTNHGLQYWARPAIWVCHGLAAKSPWRLLITMVGWLEVKPLDTFNPLNTMLMLSLIICICCRWWRWWWWWCSQWFETGKFMKSE